MEFTAEVRALAERHLPSGRVEQALAAVRPAWRLVPAADGPVRVGGPAPLAAGEEWPRNDRGIPLTFLAVIETAGLPAVPSPWEALVVWPHGGRTLRLFADLVAVPNEPCGARVLVAEASDVLRNVEPPPLPDPWPIDRETYGFEGNYDDLEPEDRVRSLPEQRCRCELLLTAEPYAFGSHFDEQVDPDLDEYERFAEALAGGVFAENDAGVSPPSWKLLGTPWLVQDDPRFYGREFAPELDRDPQAWAVLLELHVHWAWELDILDGGAYFLCVATEDLEQGRYDRVFCGVDSG